MCGRVTLTFPDVEEVARLLDAHVSPAHAALYRPRFNAAPTDSHWIVTPDRALVPAVWGFPGKSGLLINARAETADRLPAFRDAFARRRVIVAADGFYEWKGPRSDRRPVWFRPRGGGLLYLAGLAEPLPDGRTAFVVLTTEANQLLSEVHDRMPVILRRETTSAWLERPETSLLVPATEEFLTATEVSKRVNDVKNDDALLLEPPVEKPKRQLTLF